MKLIREKGLSRRQLVAAMVSTVCLSRRTFAETATDSDQSGGTAAMRIRCSFADETFTATLVDNPSSRDFAALLPLDLGIEDYSTNEKIAYLPRKLTEHGARPFANEAPGDLCYYAPWGNLAFFHGDYKYSSGLIRLGRLDDGPQPLLKRGKFSLRIERLPTVYRDEIACQ
jgi:hypothetical protein